MQHPGERPVRVVYNQSGAPTSAIVTDDDCLVDYTLYWIPCVDLTEAHFVVALINSRALQDIIAPLMAKGQYGARHLQKHLWRLSIPKFDSGNPRHVEVAEAGKTAAAGAAQRLAQLREERDRVTVTIARRELRKWLRSSEEGAAAEVVVKKLLGT